MLDFFKSGLQIGRIRYTAHPTALILLYLVVTSFQPVVEKVMPGSMYGSLVAVMLGLGLILSLLLHEAGHAYTANYLGVLVEEIQLFALGGLAKMTSRPRSAHQEFLIAFAGPLVSFALWLILGAPRYFGVDTLWAKLLGTLGFYNLAIALFNMVPAFPLDGGRVFRSAVWGLIKKSILATTIAVRVSEVIVAAYLLLNLYAISTVKGNIIFTILLSAFIVWAGEMELKMLKREEQE